MLLEKKVPAQPPPLVPETMGLLLGTEILGLSPNSCSQKQSSSGQDHYRKVMSQIAVGTMAWAPVGRVH